MATCPFCGTKGLGEIINADGKKVLTENNLFGVTSHGMSCPEYKAHIESLPAQK